MRFVVTLYTSMIQPILTLHSTHNVATLTHIVKRFDA